MDLKRISRGLKATFGARLLHMVASGLLMVVLVRYLLSSRQYGMLGSAVAVLGVAQLLGDLGIGKAAARYVTEYRENDPGQVPYVVRAALVYRIIAVALVAGGFVLFGSQVAELIGQPDIAPLLVAGAGYVVVHSLFTFTQILFQGFNLVTYSSVIRTVGTVSRLGLAVLFVVVFGGAMGALTGYIVGYGIGAALGLGLLYVVAFRDAERAEAPEDGLARKVLRYSVPLTVTRGANVIDKRVDTILVGYFIGPVAVGYYYLAKQIVGFVQTPAASLGFTLSPTYGEHKAGGDTDSAAKIYETTLKYTLLLYVPAAAGIVLVAEPTITLIFGSDMGPAAQVLQVFSGYVVLQAIAFVTSDALDYLGRARSRAYAKGATSIGNFLLNLVMIPRFGVVGAAAATVVTFGGYTAVNVAIIHSELSLSVRRLARHLAAVGAVAGAMSVAVYAALNATSGVVAVAGSVLVGIAVWGALSVAGGLLDPKRVASVLS
ncbi:oligosaccharide flippase family protein [Halorussus gelatinilyticus]|uniref:Oligosaccharide flippase family protein n=1 Tax=Halorussus gelatinilyticus TaxID=2937524 RepID=A0A8U0IIB8_9EURY|nr:oligosaccharide flippase family protein [Halorussus gelatinilyticus]UPW00411.1 oligosaccharide flippase family protein [Halorussus gelatinilyticus]